MTSVMTKAVKELLANYKQTEYLQEFIRFLEDNEEENKQQVDQVLFEMRKDTELKEFRQRLHQTFKHFNPKYSIFDEYNVFQGGYLETGPWMFKKRMKALFLKHNSFAGFAELCKNVPINLNDTYKAHFASYTVKAKHPTYKSGVGIIIKDPLGVVIFQQGYYIGTCNDIQAEYFALLYAIIISLILGKLIRHQNH